MMKQYKLLIIPILVFVLASCENELEEKAALSVNVVQNENVKNEDGIIVVKKGEPILFNLSGDPDNITFFSGETGKKYIYKDRDQVSPNEITSSKLTFSVWAQYGNAKTTANILKIYISNSFQGLVKNNFREDSILVENFSWTDLVDQSQLPQKPSSNAQGATAFEIDLASYLGKRFAIAICYQGVDNSAAQPRINFVGMKIENLMQDGTISTLFANNFNFTPINMLCHHQLEDQRGMTANREYGTVTNNVSGIWNLTAASNGNFFIHSSNAGKELKYSWLVSDLIMSNACSPDVGIAIKNITQRLDSYTYIYNETGTYTATFVATNSNYKNESSVINEMIIKVID